MSPYVILPIVSAIMFALYQILTRMVAADDPPETSFFWTGIGGLVLTSMIGPFFWQPIAQEDWIWMLTLSATAITGHFLLIQALAVTEAAVIQPFNYLHLVFITLLGVTVFGETVDVWTVIGASIVVLAGIFTLIRSARVATEASPDRSGPD